MLDSKRLNEYKMKYIKRFYSSLVSTLTSTSATMPFHHPKARRNLMHGSASESIGS